MDLGQNLGLGAFTCLHTWMTSIAILRVGGIRYNGIYDNDWTTFWQEMEMFVAVVTFSFTVFRSIFVSLLVENFSRLPLRGLRVV